jgi:hypothetical protein
MDAATAFPACHKKCATPTNYHDCAMGADLHKVGGNRRTGFCHAFDYAVQSRQWAIAIWRTAIRHDGQANRAHAGSLSPCEPLGSHERLFEVDEILAFPVIHEQVIDRVCLYESQAGAVSTGHPAVWIV